MALINYFKIIKYVSQDRATSCTQNQSWRKKNQSTSLLPANAAPTPAPTPTCNSEPL